ncbi:MAG: anhydro-N-acetylmuramic acid kinase [Burkholderiaceae bacterium]|jgi:anhydro-N-acetylmuramic acid kinase|nr:MAG: anhydro-N-acetylmuramic acid kinase [Burkholderiaceae bacterium]
MDDAPDRFFIGLMSGTSLDGVDGVLVDLSKQKPQVAVHRSALFAPELRAELLALNTRGDDELHRAAQAANALAQRYADVVAELLAAAGIAANQVAAIGAHGQTVRHHPRPFDAPRPDASPLPGYTLQLNNPALLAELTGITVVADFRSRDVAAGGEGAPLVPAFHREVFGEPGRDVAVLNLGGIANLSLLFADGGVRGFDCGPGNALIDGWCQRHTGHAFDAGGAWAASGRVDPALLGALLAEPFLAAPPPKSTGRDLFNMEWLQARLQGFAALPAADVQATLAEFTARCAADALSLQGADSCTLIVCGGGALNTHLMQRLQAGLPLVAVTSSEAHGLPPLQVEAAAFAWLARKTLRREPGNLPGVTGARGPRVLGAIHPA